MFLSKISIWKDLYFHQFFFSKEKFDEGKPVYPVPFIATSTGLDVTLGQVFCTKQPLLTSGNGEEASLFP